MTCYENPFVAEVINAKGHVYELRPHIKGYPVPRFDPNRSDTDGLPATKLHYAPGENDRRHAAVDGGLMRQPPAVDRRDHPRGKCRGTGA